MKCFHFTNGEKRDDENGGAAISRTSKVSWARSFSVASRRSEFDSESRDFSDSVSFHEFLTLRRANDLRVFTFADLKSATRGFSRALIIGEGGFGSVYRGVVRVSDDNGGRCSKMDVAIKQLNRNGFQIISSSFCNFSVTMATENVFGGENRSSNENPRSHNRSEDHSSPYFLSNGDSPVKHPHLVKLVGYCAEDDERGIQRLLVYELMHNKSLEDHLLFRIPSPLSWMARLRIVQDAARGLAYLHEEIEFQLIFRDFKTSNILLDEDFNAKLSDFGLARQGPAEGTSHVETSVVGTVGYAAPEYVQTGRLTAKSDVWSFGVVLYELITGRRAVDRNLPWGEHKLLEWVRPYVSDSKKFYLIVDPRLEGQYCIKSAQKLASLANKCLTKNPKSRPKMSEVVEILENIISETSSQDEETPQPVDETEETKGETMDETQPTKQGGNNYLKKVLDLRDKVNLKSKSIGKLDWKTSTPGLVRTW